MKRRTFVAAGGSGLGAAVAGCLGDSPAGGSSGEDDDGENDTADGGSNDGSEGSPSGGESDGTGYTVTLENDPVETVGEFATLRAELVDPHVEAESPAAIEVTLANEAEETLAVTSGAPSPFGVLWAESEDGGESITLWNDAYEETGHVRTDGKRVAEVEDIAVGEEIGAGESVARTFEIHEDTPDLETGTYETSITPRIEVGDGDGIGGSEETEGLEAELVLTIEAGSVAQGTEDDGSETDGDDDSGGESDDAYTVSLEDAPMEDTGEFATLQVEVVDPHVEPGSPAAFDVTLSDVPDGTITVSSGAPSPFGVLRAEPDDGSGPITLWTDAYEESRHVDTDGTHVELVQEVGLYEEFDGGEPITRRFEIHGETPNLDAGSYESSVDCGIEPEGADESEWLEVEFEFAIEDGVQSVGDDGSTGEPDDTDYTVRLEDDPVEDAGEFATLRIELVDSQVEPESPAALEATLANTVEEAILVTSGAPAPFGVLRAEPDDGEAITLWSDAYEETDHVQTDGRDVEMFTNAGIVSELEAGESITRTFEIHAETSNLESGTYESSIGLEIEFGDEGNHNESRDPDGAENLETELVITVERGLSDPGNGDGSDARIDEPPYEIEEPDPPDDPGEDDDWNEHYLGEEMPAGPSIGFEELDGVRLETFALSINDDDGDQYALDLIESEGELEERFDLDGMDGEDRERVEAVDFDERLVVVAESGFGSGSVRHRWKRVEESEEGVHLHGYYTQPYIQTDDYGSRLSVLVVERPDGDPDLARASLTVSPERRVHFDSTEGVVTVEGGD